MSLSKALTAAAGNAGAAGESLYVEDVFSTYLYEGNGASQKITNGIKLVGVPSDGVYVHLDGENFLNKAPTGISVSNNNVSLSTSVKKFGSSSLSFNSGNPSYLYLSEPAIDSSDAFCVETWAYFSGTTGAGNAMQMIAAQYINSQSGRLLFGAQDDNVVVRVNGGTVYLSGAVSADTWQHIAWTYDGTTHRLFVNGDLKDTSTSMPDIFTGINTQIGGTDDSYLAGYDLTGFLDEFRITKGKARYTSNFSVPTAAFPVDTDDGSGEGGLVWLKSRSSGANYYDHVFCDTERGSTKYLASSGLLATAGEQTQTQSPRDITSFNSDGFSLGIDNTFFKNVSGQTFASWTFRKAEKFFDVVTWTGDGVAGREIAHNLGSVPACIIVKRTDSTAPWIVYHSSIGNNKILQLEDTLAAQTLAHWYNTNPTSSVFTVNSFNAMNASGGTYVAYLFASDAGGFGDDGSESIIKCGSYTGNGDTDGPEIDCGFEPQFLLLKSSSVGGEGYNWLIYDNMRGFVTGGDDAYLRPNLTGGEGLFESGEFLANGFKLKTTSGSLNANGATYIYIAIRRPMKTPESGTEVFEALSYTGTGGSQVLNTSFASDTVIHKSRTSSDTYNGDIFIHDRLRGVKNSTQILRLTKTNAESGNTSYWIHEMNNDNLKWASLADEATGNLSSTPYVLYNFKRATGFFDVVAYTGNSTAGRTVAHNLGVAPELMIFKNRSQNGDNWVVYSDVFSPANYLKLNNDSYAVADSSNLRFNNTAPTATVFTVGTSIETNFNGQNYISYHFATLAGISKVGSYTGTGSNVDVDCGFSAGARFILIKRSDSGGTGDWYVYDSVRGIVAGNDPYFLINSTAAEVTNTDYIDPLSSGFTVTSSAPAALNASGGTYIFLAIA